MASDTSINRTLELSDLRDPAIRPTVRSLNAWVWRWLLSGGRFAVNGSVKRRAYIRAHKLWEYARGLALTSASAPARTSRDRFTVLDVGGAMTAPVFYLAGLGDRVLCLDIDEELSARTNRTARRRGLRVDARTINLATDDPGPADLGALDGFDRIYSFCVIEHVEPPGQTVLARRMGKLLKPGGQLCLTFDYGEDAPTEAPICGPREVKTLCDAVGLPLRGGNGLVDTGSRHALNRRHPDARYTFGSLFFHRPR